MKRFSLCISRKNLILVARRQAELEELKLKINEIHPELDVVIRRTDLSVTEEVYKLYESLQSFQIETWINNAGFGNFASIAEQNLNKIETMLHVNIEALTILSSLFVRDYSMVDGTQLINVSSGGGYTIVADAVTYCATKFYVSAFTEGLSHELKQQGAKLQAKVLALQLKQNLRNAHLILMSSNTIMLYRNSTLQNKWHNLCLIFMIAIKF